METKVLDKIGNEIKPGCIITYAHMLGRSPGLRIGKVLAVNGNRVKIHGIDACHRLTYRPSVLHFPNRMLVIDIRMIKQPEVIALLNSIKEKDTTDE